MPKLRDIILATGFGLLAYSTQSYAQESFWDKLKQTKEKVREDLEKAKERAKEAAERAREKARQTRERLRESSRRAVEFTRDKSREIKEKARELDRRAAERIRNISDEDIKRTARNIKNLYSQLKIGGYTLAVKNIPVYNSETERFETFDTAIRKMMAENPSAFEGTAFGRDPVRTAVGLLFDPKWSSKYEMFNFDGEAFTLDEAIAHINKQNRELMQEFRTERRPSRSTRARRTQSTSSSGTQPSLETIIDRKFTVSEEDYLKNYKIAFTSARAGIDRGYDIYIMDANGSNQTNLTNNPLNDDKAPSCSSNGKITFMSKRDGDWEIYKMNIDGSNQTNLTNNPNHDVDPSWSPNGNKITFSRKGKIYTMNIDGSNQRNLGEGYSPTWSPDGKKIVFVSGIIQNKELYIMDANGSDIKRLTNNHAIDKNPIWSPDGKKISFTSDRDGNFEIYVMNIDGSNQTNLTNNPNHDVDPSWSPDGSKIAFTRAGKVKVELFGSTYNLMSDNIFGNIYIMDANGSNQKNLTKLYDGFASWCPITSVDPIISPKAILMPQISLESKVLNYLNKNPGSRLFNISMQIGSSDKTKDILSDLLDKDKIKIESNKYYLNKP